MQLRGSAVSRSSSDKRGKATVILSTGDFTQAVDRVKALIPCHVFSVARRPVAGDSVVRVKAGLMLGELVLARLVTTCGFWSRGLSRCVCERKNYTCKTITLCVCTRVYGQRWRGKTHTHKIFEQDCPPIFMKHGTIFMLWKATETSKLDLFKWKQGRCKRLQEDYYPLCTCKQQCSLFISINYHQICVSESFMVCFKKHSSPTLCNE